MKMTVYITAEWSSYRKEFDYRAYHAQVTLDREVPVAQVEVEFESPTDKELRRAMHAALIRQRQEVLAKAQVEANAITQEAQELLALEDHSNA